MVTSTKRRARYWCTRCMLKNWMHIRRSDGLSTRWLPVLFQFFVRLEKPKSNREDTDGLRRETSDCVRGVLCPILRCHYTVRTSMAATQVKLWLQETVRLNFVLQHLSNSRLMWLLYDLQFETTAFFSEEMVSSFVKPISWNWFSLYMTALEL
jgi:hypothetical protein